MTETTPTIEDEMPEDSRKTGMVISAPKRRVTVGKRRVEFTRSEFDILLELARRCGRVMTGGRIIELLCGQADGRSPRLGAVFICKIRKKLQPHGGAIETVRNVGYRLVVRSGIHRVVVEE